MAACEIKRNNWKEAIAKCNAVLKVKSSHPKALFRRVRLSLLSLYLSLGFGIGQPIHLIPLQASAYIEIERFVEAEQVKEGFDASLSLAAERTYRILRP